MSACSITTRTSRARWPSTGSTGPVIGIAYDGTGYGPDGTSVGRRDPASPTYGVVRARSRRSDRSPLVGGDRAIREPWRIALALLDDAFGDDAAARPRCALFANVPRAIEVRLVADDAALADANAPRARGVGRYFDAFGALVARAGARASFEGQIALAWNQAADPSVTRRAIRSRSTTRPRRGSSISGRPCARRSPTPSRGATVPAICGAVPQHARRGDRRARASGASRRVGALPIVADRRLLPERAAGRGRARGARARSRRAAATRWCRPATAASRSARRSSPTRSSAGRLIATS